MSVTKIFSSCHSLPFLFTSSDFPFSQLSFPHAPTTTHGYCTNKLTEVVKPFSFTCVHRRPPPVLIWRVFFSVCFHFMWLRIESISSIIALVFLCYSVVVFLTIILKEKMNAIFRWDKDALLIFGDIHSFVD